ncbi:uncharacterized protein LOC143599344 [Bidens hawaiensis]|uniref:uncharacterized protein LOC143599344 n=1 Tax=Bidens hawaiensis TaxID=980011 RepID=UPI00404A4AE5
MRKLYHTKGKIHPSPPSPSSTTTSDQHLSLLPFAIATLAATLPPQDQQVLAYLLSISATTTNNNNNNNNKYAAGKVTTKSGSSGDHAPQFKCNCFRCYTSFWVRWDASPNRKVIHEILDAYEDGLAHASHTSTTSNDLHAPPCTVEKTSQEVVEIEPKKMDGGDEKGGSVRKIVNFIGERIWGVWGV